MSIQSKQVYLYWVCHVSWQNILLGPVDADQHKSWYELEESVGLDVISDEELQQEEEDKEVGPDF